MRITCRIRSDDGFTDVCECPEFSSVAGGLGIAWLCGKLPIYKVIKCSVTTKRRRTGKVDVIDLPVKDFGHFEFIKNMMQHIPEIFVSYGVFDGQEITISVIFGKKIIQIFYPRCMEGKIMPLEKALATAIKAHFTILKSKNVIDAGSKKIAYFDCSLFTESKDGLMITALSSFHQDTALRWYTVYQTGEYSGSLLYGDWTERKKYTPNDFVKKYGKENTEKSTIVMYWKGKHLSVTCDHKTKEVSICWDNFLNTEIDKYILWLNSAIYEQYYGSL